MRLILIRHAESEHAFRRVIADVKGCTGLTERGFQQAHMLASRLRATGEANDCATLLSSPVLRARQTADALLSVLPVRTVAIVPGIREIHPGVADGLTLKEYGATFGAFDLVASPDRPFAPGGESWLGFVNRVRATMTRLAEQFDGKTVVAITHAGFIVASVLALFDIPRPGTGARLEPVYTSLTERHFSDGVWQLVRFNDVYPL